MPKFGQRIGSAGMVLAALVALGSGIAQAAPQALALVSTYGKVGMTCEGGECSAELSSFCLDSSRFSPSRGTPYHLVGNSQIRLSGITEDGRVLSLDARSYLSFESARRHLAVKASVPRAALTALGIARVEIDIGENVALLPVPQPGDPDRITESEAAVLTGPLRQLGSHILDNNGERMQAARVTSRMINLLPARGATGAANETLWRRATSDSNVGKTTPEALRRARGAFELCRYVGSVGGSKSLRRCLQDQHDGFIDFLNSEYWEAVKTGT